MLLEKNDSLDRNYRRDEMAKSIRGVLLTIPLLTFLAVAFVLPIGLMLFRSIEDPEISRVLPRTAVSIKQWNGLELPADTILFDFAKDIQKANQDRTLGQAAARLNYDIPGFQSLMIRTGRELTISPSTDIRIALKNIDERWEQPRYWGAIKDASNSYSLFYYASALGLKSSADASASQTGEQGSIYMAVLLRTLWMTFVVTVLCILLGYPLAYFIAHFRSDWRNRILLLVLLPFWTSLLVRTTAWFVLLQKHGVINDLGITLGIWSQPLELIHNRTAVYIAMTHIMLPFMILPIYSVMLDIPKTYSNAAATLGAGPVRSFLEVYLPLSLPGLGAGALLVFILSLGFYITPALVGGPADQMLSYYIAQNASNFGNWGLAAALSVVLLAIVAFALAVFGRLFAFSKLGKF